MLGDTGSNVLGAVLGLTVVLELQRHDPGGGARRSHHVHRRQRAGLVQPGDRPGLRTPQAGRARPRSVTQRRGGQLGQLGAFGSDHREISQVGATVALAVSVTSEGACALAKHVFVTGGVASSLGKGITASSFGRLLKSRGLQVTMQKLDPYINVDPGTMSPFQHGEVFVTGDGRERLDLGHYERSSTSRSRGVNATRVDLPRFWTRSAGAITSARRSGHAAHHQRDQAADPGVGERRRRRGDRRGRRHGRRHRDPSLPRSDPAVPAGRRSDNVCYVHVTLVPYIGPSGEQKTKPTQHSVTELRARGIQPDAIVCRSERRCPRG